MGEDWVSVTEAAARLTASGDKISRSTLSRYLAQHDEALATKRDGRKTLVEYHALAGHRAENIRLEGKPPARPEQPSEPQKPTQISGAARKAMADAELRELDLAERRGELVPVSEVDKGMRDAVALMQSSFERTVESEAASLSVKYGWDERAARGALKAFVRSGLDVFHREVLKALDGLRRSRDAVKRGDQPMPGAPAGDGAALQ